MENQGKESSAENMIADQQVENERNELQSRLKERRIVLDEAKSMAEYAITAIRENTGNVYQYHGYLNAMTERQETVKSLDREILKREFFATEEAYMAMRSRCSTDALKLDIQVIEIKHTIPAVKVESEAGVVR